MGEPKNPNSIIIQNNYYPKGLTERSIWEYYQKNKLYILKEVQNREVMLVIMTDINKPVIIKKYNNESIFLTNENYDKIMHGRVVSVYSTMHQKEDMAIIDIDCDNLKLAKQAAWDVFQYTISKIPYINNATIRFTGKTSFHIICQLKRKLHIDSIRMILKKSLYDSPLSQNYTIEYKRHKGIPNLDLAPNKFRGNYITLNSLSIIGLKCMDIAPRNLRSFNPNQAII